MMADQHDLEAVEHYVDRARTIVHDLDRAGNYYETWCRCGQKLTHRVPHWAEKDGPGGSVHEALAQHQREAAKVDLEALHEVIAAAAAYIHGGTNERQDRYTDWRETYRRVFGFYPSWVHPRPVLNDDPEDGA